jgi:hypothetical protein
MTWSGPSRIAIGPRSWRSPTRAGHRGQWWHGRCQGSGRRDVAPTSRLETTLIYTQPTGADRVTALGMLLIDR